MIWFLLVNPFLGGIHWVLQHSPWPHGSNEGILYMAGIRNAAKGPIINGY